MIKCLAQGHNIVTPPAVSFKLASLPSPVYNTTVLQAKSDSEVMFCLQSNQGLIIDTSLAY